MARLFSKRPETPQEADRFQRYFQKHGWYTAGVEARYGPSRIVSDSEHQHLADGLKVGMRFHSAPVIRAADARRVELGHCIDADGRWRLFAFLPNGDASFEAAFSLAALLHDDTGSLGRHTSTAEDAGGLIDVRAVFQCSHRELDITRLPTAFLPKRGRFGLVDYEKVFCSDVKNGPDIFDLRRIDRQNGAVIVVRPDQYNAAVLPLTELDALDSFFVEWTIP